LEFLRATEGVETMTIKTIINGYSVEVYSDCGQTYCDIEKGRFTASLAALDAEGALWDSNCEKSLTVPASTIAKIERFAIGHGY
jgi:hypothetical protein